MVVPQKPYIPIGTLRAAVTYPAVAGTYSDEDIRNALTDAHLGNLAGELDREEVWSQRLSGGEQQRLAMARALLMKPDWLLLDESTSAVDEKLEAELYAVLAQRLPNTTIVSIGHRSTLTALHQRHLDMTPEGDHSRCAMPQGRGGGVSAGLCAGRGQAESMAIAALMRCS